MIDSDIHLGDMTGYLERINDQMTTLATPASLAWMMESVKLDVATPTIFVYPSDQFSTQSGESPRCRQSQKFSVTNMVICKIDTELPAVLKELRNAIVGWAPDNYSEQFKFTHRNIRYGGPMDIKGEHIWWMELYESSKQHIGQ